MASTALPPRNPALADRPGPSLVPGGGRQRRWSLALLALLVTLGSALAFVVLWMNAGGRKPVLALKQDVAAGEVLTAEDLQVVRVSTDPGVKPVASSERDKVIGRPAAIDLLAGTLLTPAAVGSDDGIERGTALISIPVPRTQLPSDDLDTGDTVVLLRTGDAAAEGGEAAIIGSARVFSVQSGDEEDDEIAVSVTIDESLASRVAAAIQAEEIYLTQTRGGG
ncbi:MAG TPA: SAF domain-containing protein [Acidimicrobiales bacterium]|nr:SAF domain-containing protein [Acidimicrobiales bacterium]